MLRLPDLNLGELEHAVLEDLWEHGPAKPGDVHRRVGRPRGISPNTVSSALKRLHEKGLLDREKVSHAYVYSARTSRAGLQRQLIEALAGQFAHGEGGFLAAFVDLAEQQGEETLRRLERMIAERLDEGSGR